MAAEQRRENNKPISIGGLMPHINHGVMNDRDRGEGLLMRPKLALGRWRFIKTR